MNAQTNSAKLDAVTSELNNEFLSSARVFAWSVREVIERSVLREVAGSNFTFSQLKLLSLVAHKRNCFYEHHQKEEQDRAVTRTEVASVRKGD